MKTLRRLLHGQILSSIGFSLMAFLALFAFFDVLDQMPQVGKTIGEGSNASVYTLQLALWYVFLKIPRHIYELMPIVVLIGSIWALSKLAQSSEFTVLRTSGLGPGRALSILLVLGAWMTLITWGVGDHLAPYADDKAHQVKARRTSMGLGVGGGLAQRTASF